MLKKFNNYKKSIQFKRTLTMTERTLAAIGQRIKELADKKNISLNKLGLLIDSSGAAVSGWVKGKNFNIDKLSKLAEVLNTSADYLLTGEGSPEKTNIVVFDDLDQNTMNVDDTFVKIPQYKIGFSAGGGHVFYVDEIEDASEAGFKLSFFNALGVNPRNCKRFKVEGNSMEPTLNDGDCILVDCTPLPNFKSIIDNKIYCFSFNGELKIKRLFKKMNGDLIIHSDNAAYGEDILHLEDQEQDQFTIIGRVIERSGLI